MKRISLRLLRAVTVSKKCSVHVRDVRKEFIMSETLLCPRMFMKSPAEMNMESVKVVKVVKPVYGIPGSRNHWFKSFTDYHKEVDVVKQSSTYSCLVFANTDGELEGIAKIEVGNTICAGHSEFVKKEEQVSKKLACNCKQIVQQEKVKFIGADVSLKDDFMNIEQAHYIAEIEKACKTGLDSKEF